MVTVSLLAISPNALTDIPAGLRDDPQALKKYFDELFRVDFRRAMDELDSLDGDLENQLRRLWGNQGLSDVPGLDDDIASAPANALVDLRVADGVVQVTIPVNGGYNMGDGEAWADDIASAFDDPPLGQYPVVSSANQQLTVGQLVTELTDGVDNDPFNDKTLPPDVIEALVIYRDLRVIDLIKAKQELGLFVVAEAGADTAETLLALDVGAGLSRVLEINRELADIQDRIDAGESTAASTQGVRTALTGERDKLLDTPGQADSSALRDARADYQNELTQLAYGLNGLNQNFLNAQTAFRQADSALATFLAGEWQSVISMPPNLQSPFRDKKARLEAERSAALTEMQAAKFEYVAALSGQPLLNQTITTPTFEGPYWQQINLFGNNDAAFDLAVAGLLNVYDDEIARVGEMDAASDLMNETGSYVYSPFRATSADRIRPWFPDIDIVNSRITAIYAEFISDEQYWDEFLGTGISAISVVLLGLALLTPPGLLAGGALATTYTALGAAAGAEAIALQSMRVNRANARLEQAQQAEAAGGGLNTREIQRLETYLGETKEDLFFEIATTAGGAMADSVFRGIKLGRGASGSADSVEDVLTSGRRSRQILAASEPSGPGSTQRLAAGELPADQRLGGTQRLSPNELPADQRIGGTQRLAPDELPPAGSGDSTIPPTTPPGSAAGLGDGQSATYRSNAGAGGGAVDEFPPRLNPGDNLTPVQPPVGGDIRVSNPLRYAGEPGSARRMYSEMDQNLVVKADRLLDGNYGPLRLEHFDYEVITYSEFERLEDIVLGNKPWTGPGALTQQQFEQLEDLYDAGNRLDLRSKLINEIQIGGVFDDALANANIEGLTGPARYADNLAEGIADEVGGGLADASRTDFGQLRAPNLDDAGANIPATGKPESAGGSGYSCNADNPGDAVRGGQPIETPTGLYVEFDASLDVLDFDADGFPLRIQGQNGQIIEFVNTPQGPWPPALGGSNDFVWPNPIQTADGLYIEFVVTTEGVAPRIGETATRLFVDILDPAYGIEPASADWLLDSLTGRPVQPGVSCVPEISTEVGGDVLAANPFWPPPRLGSPAAMASEMDLTLVSKTSRMVRQSGGNIQKAYFDGGKPGSWWTDAELERLDKLVNNPGTWAGQGPLRTADLDNLRAVNDAAEALGIGPAANNGPGPYWNWGGLGSVPLVGVFQLDTFLADVDTARTQALLDSAGSFVIGDKLVLDFLANEAELQQIDGLLSATPGFLYHEVNPGRNKQQESDDPYFSSQGTWQQAYADQWAIQKVGYNDTDDSAWNEAATVSNVVLAVIDTGLAWNHPDLPADLLWNNADEIPANGIDDDANGYVDDTLGYDFVARQNIPWDFDGHGTFVTGVIAASRNNSVGIAGITPNAKIMVLKALDGVGYTRASRLAEAIVYAADNGARVINISSGGATKTRVEQLAIDYAHAQGALVVIAAGNGGADLAEYGPGGAHHAITVAASDAGDAVPPFSNRGERISLAAPGVDVLSLRAARTDLAYGVNGYPQNYRAADDFVGADRSYYRATGTSFAAPIVSATAALIWARRPELSNVEVARMIQQSAVDISTPGRDNGSGYGRLDAAAALRADPNFFVDARIQSIAPVEKDGVAYAQIVGTAAADKLDSAWIEYGEGVNPDRWTRAEGKLKQTIVAGSVGTIPATKLSGASQWTVRLMVKHKTGQIREARYVINLN